MNNLNKNVLMNATDSSFSIKPGDLQITFNYLYFLGYSLKKDDKTADAQKKLIEEIKKATEAYVHRDWENSEAAHYTRNNFVSDIILDHFHLRPNKIFENLEVLAEDNTSDPVKRKFRFIIDYKYTHDPSVESIAPIECSILKNGHLVLSIRLTYDGIVGEGTNKDIPAYSVVDIIKKPELIRSIQNEKLVGSLVHAMEWKVCEIEKELNKIIELSNYKRKVLEVHNNGLFNSEYVSALSIKKNDEEVGTSRSRPYIGVLFRFGAYGLSQIQHLIPSVRKFVIASARTTPPFSTMFVDEENYLSGRDIYKPGRSIVYIARRGWCVFDTEEQERQAFMLGTVESTHMVITTLLATARSWRIYISDCEKKGKEIFSNLNLAVNNFIADPTSNFRDTFKKELGIATSFLASVRLASPPKGINKLLEAHAISHTARSAVRRCQDLTHISELEQVSQDRIEEYLNFMGIAEDYLQIDSLEKNSKSLRINNNLLIINIIILIIAVYNLIPWNKNNEVGSKDIRSKENALQHKEHN